MFGHHKQKREKKRFKQEQEEFKKKQDAYSANQLDMESRREKEKDAQAVEKAAQSAAEREKGYASGIQKVKDLYADESIVGLDPKKRQAMQYEANKGIQRSMQSANRKLLGDQASHGIVGKGGVGYAQQRDLQKLGAEAQSGVHRDLDKLNADLRMKNLAATFAGGQGEAAQAQLDKQLALDELNLSEEKKRQRLLEDQIYRQFTRV